MVLMAVQCKILSLRPHKLSFGTCLLFSIVSKLPRTERVIQMATSTSTLTPARDTLLKYQLTSRGLRIPLCLINAMITCEEYKFKGRIMMRKEDWAISTLSSWIVFFAHRSTSNSASLFIDGLEL